jgi:hypothetical protein
MARAPARIIAGVKAFSASGRSKVTEAVSPSISYRIPSAPLSRSVRAMAPASQPAP